MVSCLPLLSCELPVSAKENPDRKKYISLCNIAPAWSIQHCIGCFPHKSCLLAMGQHWKENILINIVLILFQKHSTGRNLVQCCQRGYRQQCTGKTLFSVVLIPLGEHGTGKYPMQCCPWGSRQQCTERNSIQCCPNTFGTTMHK